MGFNLIGVGEVLWDLLPSGPQLGGAPANFAYHAHALGAQAGVITRVGKDTLGDSISQRFVELGIGKSTVQVDAHAPTGTVSVTLSASGIPNYVIHEQVAWDFLEVTPAGLNSVSAADAVCFGSLAQRGDISRAAIQKLMAAASPKALRIFDVKLRQKYFTRDIIEQSLKLANVFKLNEEELEIIGRVFELGGSVRDQIEALSSAYNLHLVALTRGADGSLLYQGGQWSDCKSDSTNIADTVGAGDAFTAALVMGLLRKKKLEEINSIANEIARYVCSRAGATPPLPDRFSKRLAGRYG